MPDETQVTLTVTVTPEQASYIIALVSLWSEDEIELNDSLRALPPLIRNIALEINASHGFHDSDVIESLAWTKRDIKTIDAILSDERLDPLPTERSDPETR